MATNKITIVTTVGTSIYTNFQEAMKDIKGSGIKDTDWKIITSNQVKDFNNALGIIDAWKNMILNSGFFDAITKTDRKWTKNNDVNFKASAEINTLQKLLELIKAKSPSDKIKLKLYLLHSDTPIARGSSELIESFVNTYIKIDNEEVNIFKINKLNSTGDGMEGMENLISVIHNRIKSDLKSGEQIYINMSGGYKGYIPILSIYAQLFKIPMFYIFEESEELIEIPILDIEYSHMEVLKIYRELYTGTLNEKEYAQLKAKYPDITLTNYFRKAGSTYRVSPFGQIAKYFIEENIWGKKEVVNELLTLMKKDNISISDKSNYLELPILHSDKYYDYVSYSFLYNFFNIYTNPINPGESFKTKMEERYEKKKDVELYVWHYSENDSELISKKKSFEKEAEKLEFKIKITLNKIDLNEK